MATSGEPRDALKDEPPPDDEDADADAATADDDDDEAPPEDEAPPDGGAHAADAHRDDKKGEDKRGRLEGFIPDIVKRTFYAGLGAVFTTEEGIRKIASDLKLPKDVANY